MNTTIFLATRVLHVLAAALWLGSVVFIALILMPALQQSGPEGGAIMGRMDKRGMHAFMGSISGLTLLSGFALYWHLIDSGLSGTTSAKVFGAGGVFGLIAGILGGAVVGRAAKRAAALGAQMASTPESQRGPIAAEIQKLRGRMVNVGAIVIGLLVVALALMTIGHYV